MPFENIFSKTKTISDEIKCPNPKIPIIVDTREKQSLITTNLIEKKANINLEKLEIGDYKIADVIIERKTFPDFVSSIIDKRLTEQLTNMKKYEKSLLIIEGFNYNYDKFKIHENAVRGMILSVAIDFQIPIILTQNEKDTANFLVIIAKKFEKPKQEYSIRNTKTLKTIQEKKQFILEGFPGIGPVATKNLIEKFGSIKNIINASEEQLKNILGKRYDSFKEILES
ncbi:MAG: ERCC4 domain-containing protein [Candidatus Pacearchaeota archaeon]